MYKQGCLEETPRERHGTEHLLGTCKSGDLTPVADALLSLGMLSHSILPTVELLISPVLGTVVGCSDLVEIQLVQTPHSCFPTTYIMLL